MAHQPTRCDHCGARIRTEGTLCNECKRHPFDRALPPGRWVGGLVKRYVQYPGWIPPWIPTPTLGVTCDCGCLLVYANETCPACLLWAELNAARASWECAVEPYIPHAETALKEAA